MTRHADLQVRQDMGLIAAAAKQIADQQVRNRGTIGGSLANGDAAAALAAEGTNPSADLNATPDYKRHLVRALTRRALTTARAA